MVPPDWKARDKNQSHTIYDQRRKTESFEKTAFIPLAAFWFHFRLLSCSKNSFSMDSVIRSSNSHCFASDASHCIRRLLCVLGLFLKQESSKSLDRLLCLIQFSSAWIQFPCYQSVSDNYSHLPNSPNINSLQVGKNSSVSSLNYGLCKVHTVFLLDSNETVWSFRRG